MERGRGMDENKNAANEPENVQEDTSGTQEVADKDQKTPLTREQFFSDAVEIAESALITVFVIVMIFCYILHPVNIVGHSMVPTLNVNYDADRNNCD